MLWLCAFLGLILAIGIIVLFFDIAFGWRRATGLEVKDRIGLKIEFIKTVATISGGLLLLFGLYFTWQEIVIAQEKHRTELYGKAMEQLGSDKLEVRLVGIYSLERIARAFEKDHWLIMEVLTAYVRKHAPWREDKGAPKDLSSDKDQPPLGKSSPPKPHADIQAILTVIGRRSSTYAQKEMQTLDLRGTDLRGADLRIALLQWADLRGASLEGADLVEASLERADLRGARLQEAWLWKASLEQADLRGARLEKAWLMEANLDRANLYLTHLEGANLQKASLKGANLWGASLEKALLGGASLKGADLRFARLEGANLSEAHLEGADLSGAIGLTREQIDKAITDEETKLPYYVPRPKPKKAESQ